MKGGPSDAIQKLEQMKQEQMNEKVDLTRLKKLPTVIVGHIFF